LAFWKTSNDFWSSASLWLLGIGLIMAALAAVMGLIDVLGDAQIRRNLSDAWLHAGGDVLAVLIELYNWYSRYDHGNAAILPTGLILSLSSDLAVHGLEGLGDGLSSPRRRDGSIANSLGVRKRRSSSQDADMPHRSSIPLKKGWDL
jgi:uncharacterized membrane protein